MCEISSIRIRSTCFTPSYFKHGYTQIIAFSRAADIIIETNKISRLHAPISFCIFINNNGIEMKGKGNDREKKGIANFQSAQMRVYRHSRVYCIRFSVMHIPRTPRAFFIAPHTLIRINMHVSGTKTAFNMVFESKNNANFIFSHEPVNCFNLSSSPLFG